jgi:hypothetical protein
LTVLVQEPSGARDFDIDVPFGEASPGEYGLRYFNTSLGSLQPGQRIALQVSYSKSTSVLSAEALGLNTSQPSTTAPTPAFTLSPWVIGGVVAGLALVTGGAAGYAFARRQGRRNRPPPRRGERSPKHRHRRANETPAPSVRPPPPAEVSAYFCTQCGRRAQAGDDFCRNCGTRLR